MDPATIKTRLAITIVIASIALVVFLIVTGTSINGFTLWS